MSHDDIQNKLHRSVKVFDLPQDYKLDEIIAIFKNGGEITETKTGLNEVIITFIDKNAKELASMYDGCLVADRYTMKLRDADSFDVKTAT